MTTFNLPDLGEGLAEAEIVKWHVKEGDAIKVDQPMVSVETAKAVVEVPSPHSGKIRKLYAKAGDIVETGKPLVDFDVAGKAAAEASPAKSKDSGTVVGNMPTSDEELIETATAGSSRSASAQERVRAAPAVRALAKKLGVDLASIQGTGRGGLITVDDVMGSTSRLVDPQGVAVAGTKAILGSGATRTAKALDPDTMPASAQKAEGSPAPQTPIAEPKQPVAGEQLRGLRRGMAHSMAQSRDAVASCTLFDDADLHNWVRKTDYTVRMLRAVAVASRAEPGLNAHYDGDSMTRQTHQRVDIAIAVDTPEGLLVPTVRDVANKTGQQLRAEVESLKEAARTRTVAPEALKDFTFMLSNFGMIAGRYATPLVVPPAVAILGTGGLRHDVVAVTGGIETHLRLPLSLTFDHRCITGGEAARFLAAVMKDLRLPD